MVHPEKLMRYPDFISVHSTNNEYDPERGLNGILSILTPDPKLVTLAGMSDQTVYLTSNQLNRDIRTWLANQGVNPNVYPLSEGGSWKYCQLSEEGERIDGSLVSVGAVVKKAIILSDLQDRTGYMRSPVSSDLIVPLLPYVCEFVSRAETSNSNHKYNSMWRILGAVNSSRDQRKPFRIFKIVDFLSSNPGAHRSSDVINALNEKSNLSTIFDFLGNSGIIDYNAPTQESQGKRGKGYVTYRVANLDLLRDKGKLFEELKRLSNSYRLRRGLYEFIDFVLVEPNKTFETNSLSGKIGMHETDISRTLSLLAAIGALELEAGFKGQRMHAQISSNDLTQLFMDLVLLPAKEVADNLTPPPNKHLSPQDLTTFLQNYQRERTNIGPKGGEENKKAILEIIRSYGAPMKHSHIVEEHNRQSERKLGKHSIVKHLEDLVDEGSIRRSSRAYYEYALG